MKTVRFSQIVARCGRPSVHLSWTAPKRDRALMTALKQRRVMTVHQTVRGATKDYGAVGLMRGPSAQVLLFPKSIRRFADRRVVGIDYKLLAADSTGRGPELPAAKNIRPRDSAPPRAVKPRSLAQKIPPEKAEKQVAAPELSAPSVAALPVVGWKEAVAEIERARRDLRRRRSAAASERLTRLVERMRSREAP